jgi:hypothetical protein
MACFMNPFHRKRRHTKEYPKQDKKDKKKYLRKVLMKYMTWSEYRLVNHYNRERAFPENWNFRKKI